MTLGTKELKIDPKGTERWIKHTVNLQAYRKSTSRQEIIFYNSEDLKLDAKMVVFQSDF